MITINREIYMRPEDVAPSAWLGHIPFAGWLISALRPRLLVELGTHHGTSFLAFCQAIQSQGVDCQAFAVDTWQGDPHAGIYGMEVFDRLSSIQASKYASFSRLLRMTFDDAVSNFEDGTIDLLHIDGLHTYDAVKHDFETWLPKLSDRSIVLFHDIFERERGFGVWKFWDEMVARYPAYAFKHSHGLGVIGVGNTLPPALKSLFEMVEDERLLTSLVFERAANHVELESEVQRLQSAVQHERALRREGDRLDVLNMQEVLRGDMALVSSTLRTCFEDLHAVIQTASCTTSDLAEVVTDSNAQLQHALVRLPELCRPELDQLSAALSDVNQNLSALRSESGGTLERVDQLDRQIASLDARFEQMLVRLVELQQSLTTIQRRRWWHNLIGSAK